MTITLRDPRSDGQGMGILPGRPGVIRLSTSLRRVLAEQFSADTLRSLAALREAERPGAIARRELTPGGVDELARIIERGSVPTIGFWRRHAS